MCLNTTPNGTTATGPPMTPVMAAGLCNSPAINIGRQIGQRLGVALSISACALIPVESKPLKRRQTMTIHDHEIVQDDNNQTENFSSQRGCEKLPAKKAAAAKIEAFIEKARAEIERIEDELRVLRAQPGSPDRDRKLTPLGDSLVTWQNGRASKSRELSRLIDDIRALEGRCISQA